MNCVRSRRQEFAATEQGDTTYIEGSFMIPDVCRDLNVAILAEIIDWDYIHKFNLLAYTRGTMVLRWCRKVLVIAMHGRDEHTTSKYLLLT